MRSKNEELSSSRRTSSLPPAAPSLAIMDLDNEGKIIYEEESQPVCTPWRRVQNPASCLNDSLRFSSSPFSLKTVMAEQNLQSWSPDISHLPPRLLAFLIKALFLSMDTCLSNYWLMSSKQPDLDSITQLLKCT